MSDKKMYFKLGREATCFYDEASGISLKNKIPCVTKEFNPARFPVVEEALKSGHIHEIKKSEYETLWQAHLAAEEAGKEVVEEEVENDDEGNDDDENLLDGEGNDDEKPKMPDFTSMKKEDILTWIEAQDLVTEQEVEIARKTKKQEELVKQAEKIYQDNL